MNLAGKLVRILEIVDSGERKRVTAESAEQPEEKEIYWLGAGFQVTFEVAQAMRAVLNQPEETEEATDSGLFARSLRLLRKERRKNARVATLANGIEVLREAGGSFRYRTFLGSVGNLILRFTAAQDLAGGTIFLSARMNSGLPAPTGSISGNCLCPWSRDNFDAGLRKTSVPCGSSCLSMPLPRHCPILCSSRN